MTSPSRPFAVGSDMRRVDPAEVRFRVTEVLNPCTRSRVRLWIPVAFKTRDEMDAWVATVHEHLVRAWDLFRDDPAVLGGPHDQETS